MDIVNYRSSETKKAQQKYAVALCRVSTEDQFNRGLSIPEQERRIKKWADKHGVRILRWVKKHHSAYRGLDEDIEVLKLLEYAKTDERVSYFLVDEKSRFARRKYLRVVWQEELRRHGVQVIGVSEPQYDPNSIHGVWLEGISETKDEARSAETAYHTKKGMMRNAATRDPETGYCYKNGGIAPDGYKNKRVVRGKDSRGKDIIKLIWEINEERAEVIRYMVLKLWCEKQFSYKKIRDHLNALGSKHNKKYLNSKGKAWSRTTIREICIRALEGVYSGLYYWNRTSKSLGTGQKWKNEDDWVVIKDAHPAIISLKELERLQKIMGPTVKRRKKRILPSKIKDSPYLFSGENTIGENMFVCLNCGGQINSQQIGNYRYYLCSNYKNRGKLACNKGVTIRKDEVETKVIAAIKKHFTPKKVVKMVETINKILAESNLDINQTEKHVKSSISKTEKAIQNLISAIQQGKSPKVVPLLTNQIEKLQERKEELEKELIELKNDTPKINKIDVNTVLTKTQNLENILKSSNASNSDKRSAVRSFIRQLQFDPDKGEIYIYFWHNPIEYTSKRLRIVLGNDKKKQNKKEDAITSSLVSDNFMIKDGAGNRNHPEIIKTSNKFCN